MPATLSHRQPDLDMTSQLQENNYCNASLQSPACMRKKKPEWYVQGMPCHSRYGAVAEQEWDRGCHATAGMGQGMPCHNRYGTGDAMAQQVWAGDSMAQQVWDRRCHATAIMGRGCHATAGMGKGCHATAGMGQGMTCHSRYGQWMPFHSRYG